MCWNENVSLNTFVFSTLTLLFIWYNNKYTQYKINEFKNGYCYLVLFSFSFMQFIEYFLWKSIHTKNIEMNKTFSALGLILVRIVQPLSILLLIPKMYNTLKYLLFILYFSVLIIVYTYKYFYNPVDFKTTIDKNDSLNWKWVYLQNYERIVFVIYMLIFLTLFLTYPVYAFFVSLFLLYSVIIYKNSFGSMWCFLTNSIFIWFLFKILIVLPYLEKNKIC